MKYLLLDDDVIFNYLHDQVIKVADPGAEVICLDSGSEALNVMSAGLSNGENLPDCILLDINMPEMSGFEFLDKFTELNAQANPKSIIVMVTSSLNEKDMTKAMSYECVKSFRDKPLSTLNICQIMQLVEDSRV